ncbi:hypothetical protein CNYM01_09512 [Colletotrichum nymphaeae SA-01]|nr:hypothetical protein CNYM01_09512 [Colletotrichum nymphaeae SA-01]
MNPAVEKLLVTLVDGRAEVIRFRQDNLISLHNELRKESAALTAAQEKDTGASKTEIEAEHFLALEAVRHFYESLNFSKEIEAEYLVAHGKDNTSRRTGAGLVIIRPTTYTRLFSILSPLAAALAAGSVVVLEEGLQLEDTLSQLNSVLRNVLTRALNQNAFCITKKITDETLLSQAILVDQTNTAIPNASRANHLISANGARTVAIVDRTADIEAAAKAITAARFSFGGQSPYAPDLVLVNEFVKKEFFEACSKYASLAFARETTVKRASDSASDETRKAVQEAEDKRLASSFGSKDFKLVDIQDKNASLLNIKISGRFLPITTSSGLVDSIYTHEFENPLLAAYLFASPDAAKYLSQFLPAHVSLINQIPSNLLLGPAAPLSHEAAFEFRYNREMFSVARPQFVEKPAGALAKLEQLLTSSGTITAQNLHALAVAPLRPTNQPGNSRLGFFEQGSDERVENPDSNQIMAVGSKDEGPMNPVFLFAHGSTMMLGEESNSATYWKKCGDEALAQGIEHIVMMGAHWATNAPGEVLISAHPTPAKSPVAYVNPQKYHPYKLNPDLDYIPTIQQHLAAAGIPAKTDPTFDWIHDTYLVLIRMFPAGCPPTTLISMNDFYDPHFHVAVGAALRPLRAAKHKTLFIGSGGSVHNLYRNNWAPMLKFRDNFAQPTPPEPWALDFRQEVIDAFCPAYEEDVPTDQAVYGKAIRGKKPCGGPLLRRKVTSLMKHPMYREAHATDDHFMATMFIGGLCGDRGDVAMKAEMGAEDWELTNMCNSQFIIGSWPEAK